MLADICYDPNTGRGDPLRLQAALKLTPYQVSKILNAERDEETGKLVIEPTRSTMTPEERFTWWWVLRCLPRWVIARKWREQQAKAESNGTA